MEKWSLARAALWGLLITSIVFVVSNLVDGGAEVTRWMRSGHPFEVLTYTFGQLAWLPIIFVLVAFIKNRFVKSRKIRTQELSENEFNKHTTKIIGAATSDGVIPNDAICTTAKALGVLVAFTARRENADFNKLLIFAQEATDEFSRNSESFMQENTGLWNSYPR